MRAATPAESRQIRSDLTKVPLPIVRAQGGDYRTAGAGLDVRFAGDRATLTLPGRELSLRFLGANPNPVLVPEAPTGGTVNYMSGPDRSRWRTGVRAYGALRYRDLWPGIDMLFKGSGRQLEYEFVVRPGGRVSDIALAYGGAERLSVTGGGALRLGAGLHDKRPRTFQRVAGRREAVGSRFALRGGHRFGFAVGSHDRRRTLVIDPAIVYSTYLGGAGSQGDGNDWINDVAVDAAGNAYVMGSTINTADFPTTPGAFRTVATSSISVFVTKFDTTGSALVYSTFLGGYNDPSGEGGIAVDGSGSAYVTGYGTGFPTTPGAFDETGSSGQTFAAKLSSDGSSLAYGTYLGGSRGGDIAVDGNGNAYVVGTAHAGSTVPTTPGAPDTTRAGDEGFVTKLNTTGSALAYSTYLGGDNNDTAQSVAVDETGSAYVTGNTSSFDFPISGTPFDGSKNGFGNHDGFATKLNPAGTAFTYSTFLGGARDDAGRAIGLGSDGSAYVAGETYSVDFPTTEDSFSPSSFSLGSTRDVFVTRLAPNGSALAYSTYLGGSAHDQAMAIAVDSAGRASVTGDTASSNFQVTPNAERINAFDPEEGFLTKLTADGADVVYSTYLGGHGRDKGMGIAVDGADNVYVAGLTLAADFPTTAGAFDQTFGAVQDGFLTKLSLPATGGVRYARPGSATPMRVPLVLAYEECDAPNSAHAPPLDVPSCTPPGPVSSLLTTSSSGRASAFARYSVFCFPEVTAPPCNMSFQEEDLAISLSATDVRCVTVAIPGCSAPGSDFDGWVLLSTTFRLTDGASGGGSLPATVQDFRFDAPATCTGTANPSVGSTCVVETTAQSLMSLFVYEGKRAILSVLSIDVLDPGPDGTVYPSSGCPPMCGTGDEQPFLGEGVFAP